MLVKKARTCQISVGSNKEVFGQFKSPCALIACRHNKKIHISNMTFFIWIHKIPVEQFGLPTGHVSAE